MAEVCLAFQHGKLVEVHMVLQDKIEFEYLVDI